MLKDYDGRHLETDRDINQELDRDMQRQEALARYVRLKLLKKSDLSLSDEIFLENFEAAMHLWWGIKM